MARQKDLLTNEACVTAQAVCWMRHMARLYIKRELQNRPQQIKRDLNQSKQTRQKDLLANETCVTVQTVYSMCHLARLHIKTDLQKSHKQIKRDIQKRLKQIKRDPQKDGLTNGMCHCVGGVFDVPLGACNGYVYQTQPIEENFTNQKRPIKKIW